MNRFFLSLAALTFLTQTAWALDLTPIPEFRELEGMKIPIIAFSDGAKKINYQPPALWRSTGTATTLSLYPPQLPGAVVELRVRPRKPGVLENSEEWSRTLLPQDAKDPVCAGKIESPFTLGTLPSQEYTFSYAAQGRRFVSSIAVVDLNERERLGVVITALSKDFKVTREEAIRSMFSWNWRD